MQRLHSRYKVHDKRRERASDSRATIDNFCSESLHEVEEIEINEIIFKKQAFTTLETFTFWEARFYLKKVKNLKKR